MLPTKLDPSDLFRTLNARIIGHATDIELLNDDALHLRAVSFTVVIDPALLRAQFYEASGFARVWVFLSMG
jgi:hypothetical protein